MAKILTDKELKKVFEDVEDQKPIKISKPKYPPFLYDGHVSFKKIDIYSFYLMHQFKIIDDKYSSVKQVLANKGAKGELLMCAIIDLTMWSLGYRLGKDYSVTYEYGPKGGNTVDFKLTCHDEVFLCEAKNWNFDTYVTKKNYNEKIKTRFFCDGINILMILRNKIPAIEKMYDKYSTDNGKPINYLQIRDFMDAKYNVIDYVNVNLALGVNQLLNFVLGEIDIDRDLSLEECLHMGMPNWFIPKYLNICDKTVYRRTKSLGYNRKSSAYKGLTRYRDIRYYYKK
ncbi:hypothetical protein AYK21_02775 [Thermoplasmatales archaeon SG8-52-2]|nr:MAG: hypothetical protein AYK21_02775 [Thermoplasmatales archaeon SG8-52-2]